MIVVLVSHGDYAKSALQSVEMISGKTENIFATGLYENMNKNDLKERIKDIINPFKDEDILILNDLFGGTPSNVTIELMLENDKIHVISGFNLGILLTVITSQNSNSKDIINKIRDEVQQLIVFPEDFILDDIKNSSNDELDL